MRSVEFQNYLKKLFDEQLDNTKIKWGNESIEWQAAHAEKLSLSFVSGVLSSIRDKAIREAHEKWWNSLETTKDLPESHEDWTQPLE